MRVMVIVKATKNSEAGCMPSTELLTAMGNYNEELVKAGVMLAGEGLKASSHGKRIRIAGGTRTVLDGPFAETKELIAGYWIWQVASMDEALEWLRRCPDPMPGEESILEVRPIFELEDFGATMTDELRAQEERLLDGTARIAAAAAAPTNTIRLHRVLRAPPERVWRAFLEPSAKVKWLPPHGFSGTVHHVDARVGGSYRMSFTNMTTGHSHSFGGTYTELTPHTRIRYTDRFENPHLPGAMDVTVDLKAVSCGTDLSIVQAGVPAVIPPEMCYLGWQESLTALAQLVEPQIPD
jgi:uncharacterized protein YndB with AHSA1/START domain